MMYFDYTATTPVAPAVKAAMEPFFDQCYFNASALYDGGKQAHGAVETARSQVGALIGADADELTFTSGGTEADNLAVIGTAYWELAQEAQAQAEGRPREKRRHVLCSAVEHHAVLDSCQFLKNLGFEVELLPVDGFGRVLPKTLSERIRSDTLLVSVMWVNNELGTIMDISALAAIAHARGARFHTDAVQATGTQLVDAHGCGADLLSLTAHKIYGPKAAGALYVKRGIPILPVQHGGQQEGGLRGGTENVPAIVGFGKAAELIRQQRLENAAAMAAHKARLTARLIVSPEVRINSPREWTAPSILNVAFRNVEAEGMLFFLNREGFCLSMGSACTSKSVEPSHVIQAIGLPEAFRRGCIRVSFGKGQTEEQVDLLGERLLAVAAKLRG